MNQPPPLVPDGIEIVPQPQGVLLRRKWFTPWTTLFLFFVAIWDLAALFFGFIAARLLEQGESWGFALTCLPAVFGVGLTYAAACKVFNRTEIRIDDPGISVTNRPLPAPGNVRLKSSEIASLSLRERIGAANRPMRATYDILCARNGGKTRQILRLRDYDQADFIASEISSRLNREYDR